MEMSQITPGCYYHAASELAQGLISEQDFFSKCLSHLGPSDVRVQHLEDTEQVDLQLNPLFWKGAFGPVAAAIKLCEPDTLAGSIDRVFALSHFHIAAPWQHDPLMIISFSGRIDTSLRIMHGGLPHYRVRSSIGQSEYLGITPFPPGSDRHCFAKRPGVTRPSSHS